MENVEKNLLGETSYEYIKKSFELKNSKLYKEAIEMLYKALGCVDIGDGSLEIISQIGDLYLILKNYDRAIEQYKKALEIDKTHAHSLFQLCEIYFSEKKFEMALELITELCKNAPEEENFIKYFKILYELKLHDEMNLLYSKLDEKFKNNPEIVYILALCSKEDKKSLLEKVVMDSPSDLVAKFELGVINFNEKNYVAAQNLFQEITDKAQNAPAYHYLGLIEAEYKNHTKAIANFLKATQIEPNNDNYYFELSKSYIEAGWLTEAQICVQKSIELSQKNIDEKYYLLATINWQNKNYKNALLNLEQIPQTQDIMIFKNVIKTQLGDILEARIELEKLFLENQSNPILLSALGKIYKEMHNINKAVEIYEKALSFYPDSVEYSGELIDLLIDNKNYDRAFELAKNLKEKHPRALNAYNSLARIYYRLKDYQSAINELEMLTKLNLNDVESHYFMGLILNDMNEPKAAIEELKTAITLAPNIPKYYYQLARAHQLDGSSDSAFLFAKEAYLMSPHEVNYAKIAYEIANELGLKDESKFYSAQVKILERRI